MFSPHRHQAVQIQSKRIKALVAMADVSTALERMNENELCYNICDDWAQAIYSLQHV